MRKLNSRHVYIFSHNHGRLNGTINSSQVSYDASLQELQNAVQDHLSTLLVDPSATVKRAILHNISSLCVFLGRQRTNDVLLSHMITYLNDRDWLIRYAFFDSIVDVAACAGGRSLEKFILPLMIQALSGTLASDVADLCINLHPFSPEDAEETVVARVLTSLTSLCELGLFQPMRIWELMSATLSFLYHPNIWIRQGMPSISLDWPDAENCQVRRLSLLLRRNDFLRVTCGVFCIRR